LSLAESIQNSLARLSKDSGWRARLR